MNRRIALLSQWAGKITVVVALITLIWNISELISATDGFRAPGFNPPNQYLQVVSYSASIAVTGMLALGVGMMLERFDDE